MKNASQGSSKLRGKYAKFTPEQNASISGSYSSFFEAVGSRKPTSVQPWKGKYLAEISRKRKAGETSDLSVKSLPPSRSVGDLCRRGTPSPLTPPKTTLLTRVLARRRRIIRAREHTKIRIRTFILKALQPFIRKFAPSKIFRYTVLIYMPTLDHNTTLRRAHYSEPDAWAVSITNKVLMSNAF